MSKPSFPEALRKGMPSGRAVATQVTASGAGSLVVGLILTPVQVMKVRMQIRGSAAPAGPAGSAPSTIGALARSIFEKEGVLAFWRGLNAMLAMQAPSTAVYMVCYEAFKAGLNDQMAEKRRGLVPVVAGSFARVVAATAFAPLELVRTNQAAGRGLTMAETFRSILANRGVAGLYAGVMPTLYRDVPFSALYWYAFEEGKVLLRDAGMTGVWHDRDGRPEPSTGAVFLSAAVGGAIAAVATHPFDTIKTRMQVDVTNGAGHARESSMRVIREMGPSILYRGLGLRLMQIVPGTSAMMLTYSIVKRFMGEPL